MGQTHNSVFYYRLIFFLLNFLTHLQPPYSV